ncbi:MAG TPA: HD domain-containing protein [Gammaproteobacteria bacterium]|nr:HD domain-containing protein [Gammaproteobacteria bacterium]
MQNMTRLHQQMAFILEIDKLKHILRRTSLLDMSRRENDAEHSWHLAMMAIVLAEYAAPEVNISRVIRMVLLHDLVEIDAGDTFLYDDVHAESKAEREQQAADRIYGLLPKDIGEELVNLWHEFEERKTPDAKFAACMDRIQPVLHNYFTQGGTWKIADASHERAMSHMLFIKEASEPLFALVESLMSDAVENGFLKRE